MKNPQGWVSPEVNWGGYETLNANTPIEGRTVVEVSSIGSAEPQVLTVTLGRRTRGNPLNLDWRALVSWGGGKLRQELTCDWQNGVAIKVPASSLEVRAIPFSPRATTSLSTQGQDQTLSAIVGLGAYGGIAPILTETIASVAAAGGQSAQLVPPAFARAVSVYPGIPTDATVDPYPFLANEWVFIGGAHQCNIPGVQIAGGAAMPVPGFSRLIITNNHATEPMRPTVVWHLDAGA